MACERKPPSPADPTRRRLLATAPLAGAAALAVARGAPGENERTEGNPADPRQVVYRETDHVKAYYARARG